MCYPVACCYALPQLLPQLHARLGTTPVLLCPSAYPACCTRPSCQAAGRRTPVSGAKRGRAAAEDIYEYYDGECFVWCFV